MAREGEGGQKSNTGKFTVNFFEVVFPVVVEIQSPFIQFRAHSLPLSMLARTLNITEKSRKMTDGHFRRYFDLKRNRKSVDRNILHFIMTEKPRKRVNLPNRRVNGSENDGRSSDICQFYFLSCPSLLQG